MRKYSILSLLLLWAVYLPAQTLKDKTYDTPLWEISGNGLKQSSYIFGSLHTLPDSWLEKYPVVLSKLEASKTYIGERNLFDYLQKSRAIPRTDTPLIKMLTPDQYHFIDSFLKVNYQGTSLSDSDAVEFTIIDFLGTAGEYLDKKSNSDQSNLDVSIQAKAFRLKKKLVALETEEDLNKRYLNKGPLTELINAIIVVISHADSPELMQEVKKNTEPYLSLRINYHFSKASGNEKMIDQRNLAWLPQIIEQIKEARCFIHVGIGHMEYKNSLLVLLKNNGYTLRPVAIK